MFLYQILFGFWTAVKMKLQFYPFYIFKLAVDTPHLFLSSLAHFVSGFRVLAICKKTFTPSKTFLVCSNIKKLTQQFPPKLIQFAILKTNFDCEF